MSRPPGSASPVSRMGAEAMWDVVRWFAVFVIAVFVIVIGLFWILDKPFPWPQLF